jgi:hypothetical protein
MNLTNLEFVVSVGGQSRDGGRQCGGARVGRLYREAPGAARLHLDAIACKNC